MPLPIDLRWVDRSSAISRRHNPVDLDLIAIADGDFGSGRNIAAKGHHLRDPAMNPLRRGFFPTDLFRDRIEHG